MDTEKLLNQLKENKKMVYLLGAVVVFGVYVLLPSGAEEPAGTADLDAELASLQASRDGGAGTAAPPAPFSGTDGRGITLGGGSPDGDSSSFEVSAPSVAGTLVGYGSQTDSRGEYLVAYIRVPDSKLGYEIDMRGVQDYDMTEPAQWAIGEDAYVFGDEIGELKILARSIR